MSHYLQHKWRRVRIAFYYLDKVRLAQLCAGFILGVMSTAVAGPGVLILVIPLLLLLGRQRLYIGWGWLAGFACFTIALRSLPTQPIQLSGEFEVIQTFGSNSFQQRVLVSNPELTAYVSTSVSPKLAVADKISLTGECEPIDWKEGDSFNIYLASLGTKCLSGSGAFSMIRTGNILTLLRKKVDRSLAEYLQANQKALISGLIWGDDSGFTEEVADSFSQAGVSHITAVSGGNVGLIAGLVLWQVGVWNRKQVLRVTAVVLIAYLAWVGYLNYSALRATAMWLLLLLAYLKGFRPKPILLLMTVTTAIILINPFVIYNVGFWLSVVATFAFVAGFANPNLTIKSQLLATLHTSTVAILATSPLIIGVFGSFSFLGLIANLIALPLAALLTLLGMLSLVITLVGLPLAAMCWFIVAKIATGLILFIQLLTSPGIGYTEDPRLALLGYAVLLLGFVAFDYFSFRRKYAP